MIHWGYLILAFASGIVACYGFIYQMAKIMAQIDDAIQAGILAARF